ncbi:Mfa1 family fimbria major subunit [Parabacteroides sp. OttesenSCG-928-G06]|nr:Mfa1 family fimbria major subunit [Parabacteroides sp. OttesenSCG-928-K15]MDL2281735.1 Mfa1 family fimbria major subunit [Parabacteroides sp. OttesenSCG-928-G06]
MKIAKKTLLFGSLLCLGLTMGACTDETTGSNPGEGDEVLETGYYAPRVVIPNSLGTKADGDLNDKEKAENGLEGENKVQEVRLVYYNAKTGVAEYAFNYKGIHTAGTNDFNGADIYRGSDDFFTPKAEMVSIRDYKLLVIVNPNDAIKAVTKARRGTEVATPPATDVNFYTDFENAVESGVTTNLTEFIGVANSNSVAFGATLPERFLMTNYQGLVSIPASRLRNTVEDAYVAATTAERVYVDRAVAKVTFAKAATVVTTPAATINNISWRLDVTNKKSYWIRHQAKMKDATGSATSDVIDEAAVLPDHRHLLYAKDPNFDNFSKQRYLFYGPTIPTDISNKNLGDEFRTITESDVTLPMDDAYEYALENTMEADEQYEDVTTAAILKLSYIPAKTSLGATLGTAGYFVWNGYVFTGAELKTIRELDATGAGEEKYKPFLTLQKYLKDNASTLTSAFGADFDKVLTESTPSGDISYNKDGVNYYRVLIRHFGDNLESRYMKYGRYGLVRNNLYKLTLTQVNGPGSIVLPEPKGPDDKQQYITVDIEVLPWVVREQSVIVGGED